VALAYEILLVRLFSINQWHHYAYMIISLALLGYGVSGAFLTLFQDRLQQRFTATYLINLLLFGLSMYISYALAGRIAFNPEEILWDPGQWAKLSSIYFYLSLPFFFVANAIGLALMRYHPSTARVYGADLFGAGIGSLGIVSLLFFVFPDSALKLLSTLGIGAAWLATRELNARRGELSALILVLALVPFLLPAGWLQTTMSPYKSLSQAMQITGTRIVDQRSSPLGLITVVESPTVPLRHAPGLSLKSEAGPPAQYGVFTDGDGPAAINKIGDDYNELDFVDQFTWSLPYHLRKLDNVLILGAGGGTEVVQARYHGVKQIDAVEINPQLVTLVRDQYSEYSGYLFTADNVRVITAEARGFVSKTSRRYDLIQVALVDSFAASSAGLYTLSESYLYSVEALEKYMSKLAPDGYLAISRWIKLPSRDAPKLLATAITALEHMGVEDPGKHLALIRSWQTSTLIIKNGPLTSSEISALRRFCGERGFDMSYFPGIDADEVNRFNVMAQPQLYLAARALLSPERAAFIRNYKFNITPATDDRPYFFHFFTWRALPEILNLYGRGGIPLLDTGYLVLVATLAQAILASILLILLPLWLYQRFSAIKDTRITRLRVFCYFTALGLAFLFLEIAFIQKFILFLHHPLYAVAVVLTGFLLFAGAGSLYSARLARQGRSVIMPILTIAIASLLYIIFLDRLFGRLMPLADGFRVLISIALIAPMAFCMGIPFPQGINSLGKHAPQLIPWAWGINGCASVISAVLATLFAMHFGFTVVVIVAVALYGVAAASMPRVADQK